MGEMVLSTIHLITTVTSEVCTSLFSSPMLLGKKKIKIKDNQELPKERVVTNPKPSQVYVQSK